MAIGNNDMFILTILIDLYQKEYIILPISIMVQDNVQIWSIRLIVVHWAQVDSFVLLNIAFSLLFAL